jgi:phosphomannomutase
MKILKMNKEIFRAYDIRGVYPDEIDEDTAYRVGRAIVEYTKKKTIVVGQDMRESSSKLFKELSKGITDQGADVIEIGLCSTPMFYFAVNFLKGNAGIMITASHNPAKYNGFKLVREKAIPLTYEKGILQIKDLASANDFKEISKKGKIIIKKDILHNYVNFILSLAKNMPKLKVVVDTSNGMAGFTLPKVFEHLDLKIIHINKKLDGNFPNHEANPLKSKVYAQLKKEIKKQKADFGALFDGDADRLGFVDENGYIIGSDIITALISKSYSNEKILYDLRSSWIVKEEIKKGNNIPIISRVGHSFIKSTMREKNVIFGGELSGHYYYKQKGFYAENSILTLIKIAQIIKKENKPLSKIIKPLKKYFQSGEINSEVENKENKMKELEKIYKNAKISKLDGITIEFKDFWFNVRTSNTEPLLRLNLEAKTKKLMQKKTKEVLKVIRK